jgi:hypothetical protein
LARVTAARFPNLPPPAAEGTVVKVVDGLPEQVLGEFPQGISLEEADGNSVILDIGGGNYATYAHFQPNSILVNEGDGLAGAMYWRWSVTPATAWRHTCTST